MERGLLKTGAEGGVEGSILGGGRYFGWQHLGHASILTIIMCNLTALT